MISVARTIIEREGVEALSLRRVADELGTSATALYRHVKDKDALLVLVMDALYRTLAEPRLPADPRRRIERIWCFLHDGLARFPWIAQALVRSDTVAISVLPKMEALLEASLACDLTLEEAAALYRIVWQYTVGELFVHAETHRRTTVKTSQVLATVSTAPVQSFPLLARAAPYWKAMRERSIYRTGLKAILDGVLSAGPTRRSGQRRSKT